MNTNRWLKFKPPKIWINSKQAIDYSMVLLFYRWVCLQYKANIPVTATLYLLNQLKQSSIYKGRLALLQKTAYSYNL